MDQPWQTAYDALTKGMRDLVMNLTSLLAKNDPRWTQFGLQMPITKSTPGQPQNVTMQLQTDGTLLASCDANALTTRYRWRALVVGVEMDYRLVASTTEPLATLRGAAPGQTMQMIVQAVNQTLQGVASVPVLFTMPARVKTAGLEVKVTAEPASGLPDSAPVYRNGNGNGNGHALIQPSAVR